MKNKKKKLSKLAKRLIYEGINFSYIKDRYVCEEIAINNGEQNIAIYYICYPEEIWIMKIMENNNSLHEFTSCKEVVKAIKKILNI